MGNGLYIALSGAVAQEAAIDVAANNVANAATTAFRGERVTFGKALTAAQGKLTGKPSDTAYATVAGISENTAPGLIIPTANPLDLALVGDGFFSVDTPRGARYTRAGNFQISPAGELVDGGGNPAKAVGGGSIKVPPDAKSIIVEADGTVLADNAPVGVLELVRFAPDSLQREGTTLYATLPNAKPIDGKPEIVAGALEDSNVSGIRGVVDLIKINRSYEALVKMIQQYSELDQRIARDLGSSG